MTTTIKHRLAQGEIVRVLAFASLASPKLVEIAGVAGGFHGIWIDQEHSAIPHQQLELLLIACRAAGLDAFVRVAPTAYATVMRPMETGANGVMVAQIRTVDEVRRIVQWAKYPPLGVPGQAMHPKCIAALERVAAAVKKAGKTWGVLSRSPEHGAKCRELGCQLFSLAGDVDLIHRGFQATKKLYADFFEPN